MNRREFLGGLLAVATVATLPFVATVAQAEFTPYYDNGLGEWIVSEDERLLLAVSHGVEPHLFTTTHDDPSKEDDEGWERWMKMKYGPDALKNTAD
jgi:hypothetical protein